MRTINENRNKLTDFIPGLNSWYHDILWTLSYRGFQQRFFRRLPKRRNESIEN